MRNLSCSNNYVYSFKKKKKSKKWFWSALSSGYVAFLLFFTNADDLRMAVKEVICDSGSERRQYEEALIAITIDESLKR